MDRLIPLCVPFAEKEKARSLGARWNVAERCWECPSALLSTEAYDQLRPFVPLMYRPDRPPPHVRPMMVPQTSWGKNLRSVLSKESWDLVRKAVYQAAGNRCRICGRRGDKWPVEADELWAYDEPAGVQRLVNVIAMCPPCHKVHHFGKTTIDGEAEAAIAQMMHVNGWTRLQAEQAGADGFSEWERRSRIPWRIDYSFAQRRFNVSLEVDAAARADAVNREIVAEAERSRGRASEFTSLVRYLTTGS